MKNRTEKLLKKSILIGVVLLLITSCDLTNTGFIGKIYNVSIDYKSKYTITRSLSFHSKNEGVLFEEVFNYSAGELSNTNKDRFLYFTYESDGNSGKLTIDTAFTASYIRRNEGDTLDFTLDGSTLTILDVFTADTPYNTDPVVQDATSIVLEEVADSERPPLLLFK